MRMKRYGYTYFETRTLRGKSIPSREDHHIPCLKSRVPVYSRHVSKVVGYSTMYGGLQFENQTGDDRKVSVLGTTKSRFLHS